MSLDVLSALELDKSELTGKFLLIKEWSGSEATFVVSCLLSKELKDNRIVCLVLSHNDIAHYHYIGLKLGYNLKQKIEDGKVVVVDIISAIKNDPVLDITNSTSPLSCSDSYLKNILREITKVITTDLSIGVTVIFDGLTHFLDVGYSLSQVNLLVQNIITNFVRNQNSALAITTHLSADDSIDATLSNILHYLSDVVCEVKPLATGASSHVSGHLKFIKKGPMLESVERHYHYKLLDRGVKILSPGL